MLYSHSNVSSLSFAEFIAYYGPDAQRLFCPMSDGQEEKNKEREELAS